MCNKILSAPLTFYYISGLVVATIQSISGIDDLLSLPTGKIKSIMLGEATAGRLAGDLLAVCSRELITVCTAQAQITAFFARLSQLAGLLLIHSRLQLISG